MPRHAIKMYHKEFFLELVKYGVPAIVEMMMTSFGSLVLGMFIGRNDVGDIYASYTLTNNVYAALYTIFNGLFIGITVVLVRHSYREHDRHNSVATTYITVITVFSLVMCALFALGSSDVIGLFYRNAEPHVFDGAVKMFIPFCLVLFLHLVVLVINACFRGVGNFKVPTVAMILMSVLSAGLGAVLIMYLKLGMTGIVITMLVSRIIPLLYEIVVILIGKSGIAIDKITKSALKETKDSVLIGSMALLEQLGIQVAYLILQSILVGVGTTTLTGYQSANSILSFIYVISGGLTVALVTSCGKYYAERKLRKTKGCAWYFTLVTYVTAGAAGLVCAIFPGQMMSLFLKPGEAHDIATKILPLLSATLLLTSLFQVMPGLFKAIGNTRITFIIAVTGAICIRIPCAYLFITVLKMGYVGIVLALSIDYFYRFMFYLVKTYRLFRKPVHS